MKTTESGQARKNKRRVGNGYERAAGAFLKRRGYRILTYNFRYRQGEIDIVALDGDTLVFVEVKYRSSPRAGDPLEAVNCAKQQVICRCADFYRVRFGYGADMPCRFDVVGILGSETHLIKNAFEYIPQRR